jgi:hypothetical protein
MNSITLQNFDNHILINNRINSRNYPSQKLEPAISNIPLQTKYNKLPILDNYKESTVKHELHPTYNSEKVFFPGNRKPHYSGFATNIDEESLLRNQYFALQKCDRSQYIPATSSDMYVNNPSYVNTNININNYTVFQEPHFDNFNPNISYKIGSEIFNNSTRVQLKDL